MQIHKPNLPFVSIFWIIWLYRSKTQHRHAVVGPKRNKSSDRWSEIWWYGMSWYMGKSLFSPWRYLNIELPNSSTLTAVIDLLLAILVAETRSQKFPNSWFSRLLEGKEPHRRPRVTMTCTMQKTRHPSADIFPCPLSPIRGGAGEHQEGSIVFSISFQISWSLNRPSIRVLPWFAFACFARPKRSASGFWRLWNLSIIPSLCLYHVVLAWTSVLRRHTYSFRYSFYQHSFQFPPDLVHRCLIPFVLPINIHVLVLSRLGLNFDKV